MNLTVDRLKYYKQFKDRAIEYLGGCCVECGSEENLEFDHIYPEDKKFTITDAWAYTWEKVLPELNKCQLLCHEHHVDKHRTKDHGTKSMYVHYKCRCEACRDYWNTYMREYRRNKRIGLV